MTKSMLVAGAGKMQLVIDMQPEWVTVGYGAAGAGMPIGAAIALGYDALHLPMMKTIVACMRTQHTMPTVSIYDDTVQIVFSVGPIPDECRTIVRAFLGPFTELADELQILKAVSAGDICRNDESFMRFEALFEHQGMLSLVLMQEADVGDNGGHGEPFDVFIVREVLDTMQDLL